MGCASSTPFLSAHGGPVKNMDQNEENGSSTDIKDGQIKESIIGAVTNIGHSIGDVVKNGTHDIKEMVTTSIEKVPDEIKAHVNKLLNDDKQVIENSLDDLNQTIDNEVSTIKENTTELSNNVGDGIQNAVNDTEQKLNDVKDNISDVLQNAKDDLLDIESVDSMDSLKTTIPEPEIENALKNSIDDELNSPTPKPTYSELEILKSESDAILQNNRTPTNENLANHHKCLSEKLDNLATQFENFLSSFQVNTSSTLKNIATSTTSSLEANHVKNENIIEHSIEHIAEETLKENAQEDSKEKQVAHEIITQEQNEAQQIEAISLIDDLNVDAVEKFNVGDSENKKSTNYQEHSIDDIAEETLKKNAQEDATETLKENIQEDAIEKHVAHEIIAQEQNGTQEIEAISLIDDLNVNAVEKFNVGDSKNKNSMNYQEHSIEDIAEETLKKNAQEDATETLKENVQEDAKEKHVAPEIIAQEQNEAQEIEAISLIDDLNLNAAENNQDIAEEGYPVTKDDNIHDESEEIEPAIIHSADKLECAAESLKETTELFKNKETDIMNLNNMEQKSNILIENQNEDINFTANSNEDNAQQIQDKNTEQTVNSDAPNLQRTDEIDLMEMEIDRSQVKTDNTEKTQITTNPYQELAVKEEDIEDNTIDDRNENFNAEIEQCSKTEQNVVVDEKNEQSTKTVKTEEKIDIVSSEIKLPENKEIKVDNFIDFTRIQTTEVVEIKSETELEIKPVIELLKSDEESNRINMLESKISDQSLNPSNIQEIDFKDPTPQEPHNIKKNYLSNLATGKLLHNVTKILGLKTDFQKEVNTEINIMPKKTEQLNEIDSNAEITEKHDDEVQLQEQESNPITNNQKNTQQFENTKKENKYQNKLEQPHENLFAINNFTVAETGNLKTDFEVSAEDMSGSNIINDTTQIGIQNNISIPDEIKSNKIDVQEPIVEIELQKKKKFRKKIKSLKLSKQTMENDVENESKSTSENILAEELSASLENIYNRPPSPMFRLVHRREEFRKLGWSFLLANLDTLREIRNSSGIVGNEILATLNILNYFVVEYDRKHRTIFDRINTKLEKLHHFLREKFTHFYIYEQFRKLFKNEEEPRPIIQKIVYESDTEAEIEEIEETEPEEIEEEESEEEETEDELPALDLSRTVEELLNDIEFLVNKDPNDENISSEEDDEITNLSDNEFSETELENNKIHFKNRVDQVDERKGHDAFKISDNHKQIPTDSKLIKSNSIESDRFNKIDEILPYIQIPDTEIPDIQIPDTQIPDTQITNVQIPDTQITSVQIPDTQIPDTQITSVQIPDTKITGVQIPDTQLSSVLNKDKVFTKKTSNFLTVTPFKAKKKKNKKKFTNRIPIDPTRWEALADELAMKDLKKHNKLSRNYSSESVWSGDAGSWKKPNSLYLVFGNNFLHTPKIKIIESGHTNQWTQRTKKEPTELDVYTGKLVTDTSVFQDSQQKKRRKWNSFELEMKASQLDINKKMYNLTDTEDYPTGKSQTEITLNWLKNDIKRFKQEYGPFNREQFGYFDQDSDFYDENNGNWGNRSNRLPFMRNINRRNKYDNFNLNQYQHNYHRPIRSGRFPYVENTYSNEIHRIPPNRNVYHKDDKNLVTKSKNISKKLLEDDVYYSSSNSETPDDISEDISKIDETKSKKILKDKTKKKKIFTNSEDEKSEKSMKKNQKNRKNKKLKKKKKLNSNSEEQVTSNETNDKEFVIKTNDEMKNIKNESNRDSDAKSVESDENKIKTVDANNDITSKKPKKKIKNKINSIPTDENDINKLKLSKGSSEDSKISLNKRSKVGNSNDSKKKTNKDDGHNKSNDFNDYKKHKREKHFEDPIQNNLNNEKKKKSKNQLKDKTEDSQQTCKEDSAWHQSIVEDKRKYRTEAWLKKQGKNSTHIESSEIDSNGDPIEKKNFKLPYIKSQHYNKEYGTKHFKDQSFSEDSDVNEKYKRYEEHSSRNKKLKDSFDYMHKDFTSDSEENQYDKYHRRSKFMNESQKYYNYYE